MEGVELSSIFSGLVLCIACNRSPPCYNTRMTTNHHDQLSLVRTRNREIFDDRFLFQTVWSFSPDGINTETYVVSAVVTIPDESICETYVFPSRDENGEFHSYAEVWSSPHFLGHHNDHKLLVGEFLRKCAQDQHDQSTCGETLENLSRTS